MTSKIDQYSINEDDSRAIMSKYCRRNFWKYRKMEWDNDIDGEIEIFDSNKETTAKFIKVQLKTIDDPSKFDDLIDFYNFDAEIKFLHFCDVCDLPIILSVFNIHEEEGYFIFMQEYIYNKLQIKNPNWRNNLSNVRVKVPLINSLSNPKSKEKLEKIGKEGSNLISQLRKTETYKKYYSILKQGDNSHGTALRTNLRILVEKSFANSKEAMRILIPKIHLEFKSKVYHRNEILAKHHSNKEYEVIYMFFYDSIDQEKHGLPCCRTLWFEENLAIDSKPLIGNTDEILEGINISWDQNLVTNDFIKENLLDKGEYLPVIDSIFNEFNVLYNVINQRFIEYDEKIINTDKLCDEIKLKSIELDRINDSINNLGFPPIECKELDIKLNSLIAYIHNIKIIVDDNKRDVTNIISCIRMYLNYIKEELPKYIYEREKAS